MSGQSTGASTTHRPRILFVSHETTLSGAPIELIHLAGWLNSRQWMVTIVAPEDGPVLDPIRSTEITLIFDPQLLIDPTYSTLRQLARQYDLVLANTVATWEAVQAGHLEEVPVVWYLHETKVGIGLMKKIHMIKPSLGLATALIVPTKATARIYQPFTKRPIQVVPYGIPDIGRTTAPPSQRQMIFATTATYESRKGQDVLIEAIRQLDFPELAQAEFRMAGRPLEKDFHDRLCERA
jgi:glycosyltransferase involved in cell wall biosynthesis